jgi:hypothetical protein
VRSTRGKTAQTALLIAERLADAQRRHSAISRSCSQFCARSAYWAVTEVAYATASRRSMSLSCRASACGGCAAAFVDRDGCSEDPD